VNQANAAGHEVVALRRSPTSQTRIPLMKEPIWVDATLDSVQEKDLKGCEAVVHLAAHTANVPYDTLENCLYWNLTVPLRVFQRAHSVGVHRFVVAGSCFEYGRSGERYEFIPETAPLEPTASYPTSKAAASIAMIGLAAELNLKLSIHRIFQVYGEGEASHRLWPSLRAAALAGDDFQMTAGEQVRDFIHVRSVASSLLKACEREDLTEGLAEIENLGTGRPQTTLQFCQEWWQRWSAKGKLLVGAVPYRHSEVMRYVPQVNDER